MFHGESAVMKHAGVFVSYECEICLRSPIAQSRYLLMKLFMFCCVMLKVLHAVVEKGPFSTSAM